MPVISDDLDRMVGELKAAGWTQVRLPIWWSPNGAAYPSATWAYVAMKRIEGLKRPA